MKFYNRDIELDQLEKTRLLSESYAQMTIITGRRRIGKTSLIMKSVENRKMVYLFISRKSETLLCDEFISEIQNKLDIKVFGEIKSFSELFEFLMQLAIKQHFTLIIDEFQELMNINSSIFSSMQKIWDNYKNNSKIHLIISGSVYSLMVKIFENSKEPLFGRANERIFLKPFDIQTIKSILTDNYPNFKNIDLLTLYIISGGIAKYIELLIDRNIFEHKQIINEIFKENSIWLSEGKNLLIEEFGREYTIYFSILSLLASSKTSRNEIESILQKSIGGYLDKLENEYNIIKSVRPIFARKNSRNQKYFINDNFLNFWFRFIYRHSSAVEIGNFMYLRNIVERDFDTYSGRFLEKWFRDKLATKGNFSQISSYWDKKGNEIDIVAINELEKCALIAEVKLNKSKININLLKTKALSLKDDLSGYDLEFAGYSLEDM